MAVFFGRTLRSLQADARRVSVFSAVLGGLGVVALACWIAWALLASVSVYAVTSSARLEVDQRTYQVQSPVDGRVVFTAMTLGRQVHEGEVLIEIDAESDRLALAEGRMRLAALPSEIEALREQLAAEDQARVAARAGMPVAVGEARARRDETEAVARQADDELARMRTMHRRGAVPDVEMSRARSAAAQRHSALRAQALAVRNVALTRRSEDGDRRARRESVRATIARLEGERETVVATIERLRYSIERHVVRAPIGGQLAEVAAVTIGAVVSAGQTVAAVLPRGELRLVADYAPAEALGRVAAGQTARMRLDGFPWMQYGVVAATVTRVARELRDGKVRVELALDAPAPSSRIPLQHGLPGTVEIEVERVSPAQLVLRAVGKALSLSRGALS